MLIVLEGLDGSGKATQAALLGQALSAQGRQVRSISFPDYQSPSSALVKMYLNGEIGSLDEVNPYAASSFYSLDRYISFMRSWREDYAAGTIILADRYTTSNFCHQMGKLPREKWESYLQWLTDYEYRLLGLPAPDGVIYLDMPPAASQRLIEARYHGDPAKKDLHEANAAYLAACRRSALYSAERLGWQIIPCADDQQQPLPVETIFDAVLRAALSILGEN
ncbi:MAG: thymidylate kinase [Oscillospiraceae bacterium]|nr:MAG: thymidylate kinase [Oscillospiraceae bacterium]